MPKLSCSPTEGERYVTNMWIQELKKEDGSDYNRGAGAINIKIKCGEFFADYSTSTLYSWGRPTWQDLAITPSCGSVGRSVGVMAVAVKVERDAYKPGELWPIDNLGITAIKYACDYYSEYTLKRHLQYNFSLTRHTH